MRPFTAFAHGIRGIVPPFRRDFGVRHPRYGGTISRLCSRHVPYRLATTAPCLKVRHPRYGSGRLGAFSGYGIRGMEHGIQGSFPRHPRYGSTASEVWSDFV